MNLGGTIRLNPLGFCLIIGSFIIIILYITSGTNSDNNNKNNITIKKDNSALNVNLKSLLIAAVEVAEKGGHEVKSTRLESDLNIKSKGETKEGVNDPVTNADFRSHCIMYHTLVENFPHVKVISEEHPESKCTNVGTSSLDVVDVIGSHLPDQFVASSDVTVWIDPLDATKEFTENLVEYVTTMVCVAVKGKPVLGVIHYPFGTPTTYWAWNGQATSANLNTVEHQVPNNPPTIIVSRSHAGTVKNISIRAFGPQTVVVPAAGAGYKAIEVAKGNATIYLHTTAIKKWDVCAGDAILSSVGGSMTNLLGEKLDYSAKSNPLNEKGIIATLSEHQRFVDQIKAIKFIK